MREQFKYKKIFCVYVVYCKVSGKHYVGKAKDFKRRMRDHRKTANRGGGPAYKYFQKALRKHGFDAFEWEIHTDKLTEIQAFKLEKKLIKELNCLAPNGYNMTPGGDGATGFAYSKKQNKANSERAKKWWKDNPDKADELRKKIQGLVDTGTQEGKEREIQESSK